MTTAPPPTPTPTMPPLTDNNAWADYWYYVRGCNVIPAKSKEKVTYITWKQSGYQDNPISEEQHNEWKRTNAFAEGMAVVAGRVWRGEHAGEYFTCIDCDNRKAIDEFCTRNAQTAPLEKIAEKFIVEQHKDNPNKAHIYFYSKIPIVAKSSSVNIVGKEKIENNVVPGFEIKSTNKTIAFCTPSMHQDGHRYEIIGTCIMPITLNERQSKELMQHLENIHKKYGMQYLDFANENGKSLIPMAQLEKDDFAIYDGNNRHEALMRYMESRIVIFRGKEPLEEIKELCYIWNKQHCKPPLDDKEFEKQWKAAQDFIARKDRENKQKGSSNGNGDAGDASGDEDDSAAGDARAVKALNLAVSSSEELFLNEFGRAFAAMKMPDGHVEVHPMDELKFKNWISNIYFNKYQKLLNDEDLKKIIRILTAKADSDGNIPIRKLDIRVRGYNEAEYKSKGGGTDDDDGDDSRSVSNVGNLGSFGELVEDFDAIYYDLTNKKWQAIKITPEGWELDKHPPFLFRRFGGEVPQVYPDRNYEPDVLDRWTEDALNLKPEYAVTQKPVLKVKTVTDFFPNTTPKPVLVLQSSQGSGKTTGFELMRDLIDPNSTLTMSMTRDIAQLKQDLAHNYMSFFDNVSDISEEQSNTLCRGVTGAGDRKRKLFENEEDIIISYRRIEGVNGITNIVTRSDLLDRGLAVDFADIPKSKRDLLRIIRKKHLELKPKVLAFCLDVISEVMAERKKWKGVDEYYFGLKDVIDANGGLPRMADWAILGEQVAAVIARKEGKPYIPGSFLQAFDKNLEILNTEALKSSLVAEALTAFMTNRAVLNRQLTWEGSMTMLLAELNAFIATNSDSIKINTRARAWAQDPATLGTKIAEIRRNLAPLGIEIESQRGSQNVHYAISLTKMPTQPTHPTHIRNDQNNPRDVGSVGSVGSTPNLGDNVIQELIQKAMNDKNYFIEDDWVFACLLYHNLKFTVNEAEQTLQALIQEGKVKELEGGAGKYEPTTTITTKKRTKGLF